jgi:large subunit ribosomal protein L10
LSAVAAQYIGLTVEDLTNLRVKAREDNVYLRVVKNTLARRALEDTDFACMSERLTGPLILAFSQEDPGAAARVTKEFAKTHDKFQVTMLSVGGELLEPSDIDKLAKLPTRDQAISMLMSVMPRPRSSSVPSTRCRASWFGQWRRFATRNSRQPKPFLRLQVI